MTTTAKSFAPDAAPQIIGDEKEGLLVTPHDMDEDIDPAYAGEYQLTHGCVRIPVPDGAGGFKPKSRAYRAGARLRLSAVDAYRFLESGVVKRIDGKKPDRVATAPSPPPAPLPTELHYAQPADVKVNGAGAYVATAMILSYGGVVLSGERCDAGADDVHRLLQGGVLRRFEEPS